MQNVATLVANMEARKRKCRFGVNKRTHACLKSKRARR